MLYILFSKCLGLEECTFWQTCTQGYARLRPLHSFQKTEEVFWCTFDNSAEDGKTSAFTLIYMRAVHSVEKYDIQESALCMIDSSDVQESSLFNCLTQQRKRYN